MISNRVKRNIWLTLAILSLGTVVERAIRVADGSIGWWDLIASILITAFCTKFYLSYRRKVKEGILFSNMK